VQIRIFKNTRQDANRSMQIYADQLLRHLKASSPHTINEFSIEGVKLPFFKDVLSKDFFYPIYTHFKQGDINHIVDHSYGALAYGLDPRKTVVTCHDLNPLEIESQSSRLGRLRFLYNIHGMLKVDHIVAGFREHQTEYFKAF